MKFRTLARMMQEQFGWNLSVTLGAVNTLIRQGLPPRCGNILRSISCWQVGRISSQRR